jgi:glycosyltransferase involved in cell wall biosynthesis
MKEMLQRIYKRDIRVVPNGVDLQGFGAGRNKKRLENFRLLFVGRLNPVKGVEYLIDAMAGIKKKGTDVELTIAGDGPERKRLENLSKRLNVYNHVRFLGMVDRLKIASLMSESDIFVLPSISEGFPLVVLEAMACGLPIIATKVGGLPEVIEEGRNGLLVNPRDSVALASSILLLLQNEAQRDIIAEENRKKSMLFGWERVVSVLEEEYRRILS